MSFWTAVVVLFAIASITWLRSQKYRAIGDRRGPGHSAREEKLEHEVEALRKRISVLERIATDDRRSSDLSREIESLRD
ncbi:hypothetical protein [Novosphingobium pentaromativorans]|uniref:Phage shock protein B n=1 Tax=Novosphingobium pentaromativorans US6-1 TaxID=1088721 RepID=G6EEI2_9SPHN|nr:hypothetical protein [Novosphingobium pentaromativorans]AIT79430.1 hypothetical protein JI59_06365 [Novosphingobium pentaromativorans US6-1]EHJ60405.1 hypothetical protein NSU_2753 [Novosphingobium pentaromativorans US6-1]